MWLYEKYEKSKKVQESAVGKDYSGIIIVETKTGRSINPLLMIPVSNIILHRCTKEYLGFTLQYMYVHL